MPRVAAFQVDGVDCRFYSNDHEPPHFHAKRAGQWEGRLFFLTSELQVQWGRPSAKDRKALQDQVEANRVALLQEWNDKVQTDD